MARSEFSGAGTKHAPKPRHAQQHQPFLRIGDIIHIGDVGERVFEGEIGRGDQKQFRIGKALEFDAERLSHRAAGAVRCDQIAAR